MKKQIVTLGVAIAMTGCGAEEVEAPKPVVETKPVESVQTEQAVHDEATKAALEQSNQEQEELKEFLAAAKERDPNIVDAYYSVDSEGNRIINLVRNAPPAEAAPTAEGAEAKPAEEKKEEDEGLGMLETVGLAMAGGMVGSMLANALVPKDPPQNYYQNNSAYYQRQTPAEAQRYRSSATASYNNYSMNNHMQSRSNGKSQSGFIGNSQSGSIGNTSSGTIGKSSVSSASNGSLTSSKPAFQSSANSSIRSSTYGSDRESNGG